MNYAVLSTESRAAVSKAYKVSVNQRLEEIEPQVVGIVIAEEYENMAKEVLQSYGITFQNAVAMLAEQIDSLPHAISENPVPDISESLQKVFESSIENTNEREATPKDIFKVIVDRYLITPKDKYTNGALDEYGTDLIALAASGKIEPSIGRQAEMDRVVEILSRKTKCNPILVGDPGVGKTAIVEGLAFKIACGECNDAVQHTRLYSVDVSSLIAGTAMQGEMENRLRSIVQEATNKKGVVLFVDEVHLLIGAGRTAGAMDAANILKPALARGEIRLIGATTEEEYTRYIESDKAFARRFQKVTVDELKEEDSIELLKKIKPRFETFHKLSISDAAVTAAVRLSKRYIAERFLPDKAIDLLDETASRIRVSTTRKNVSEDDIRTTLASWTGIPVERLTGTDASNLAHLEERLGERVIGQAAAIGSVVSCVRRGRLNLSDASRPVGSFMFVGPTGVGKTELAKALTSELMGSDDMLVRIDMSEYQQEHSVARLFGAPPGYVGYDAGGQLTEAVRRKPYCVILLDEIEKAHPKIFDAFLQVLDDGRMTDGKGRTVDFTNTIIIMTSNIGVREYLNGRDVIGYESRNTARNRDSVIMQSIKSHFRPEFLNRLDSVVLFNNLDRSQLKAIARRQMEQLIQKMASNGWRMEYTDEVIDYVLAACPETEYGARPIRRSIEKKIIEPLGKIILQNGVKSSVGIILSISENKLITKMI